MSMDQNQLLINIQSGQWVSKNKGLITKIIKNKQPSYNRTAHKKHMLTLIITVLKCAETEYKYLL